MGRQDMVDKIARVLQRINNHYGWNSERAVVSDLSASRGEYIGLNVTQAALDIFKVWRMRL